VGTNIWERNIEVKSEYSFSLLLVGSLVACLNPEDEGSSFLRNVDELVADYTAAHPRKRYFSL
jgi:hypothetical protein